MRFCNEQRNVCGLGRSLGAAAGLILLASATAPAALAADLNVVVTIKPIHALVAQVMAGAGEPRLLVQGTASPHTYALKPSDAQALNAADVVFRVSESIEPFTEKIVASLPKSVTVSTLADAPGLARLERRTGDTFEAHEHSDEHAADHDDDHDKNAKHVDHEAKEAGDHDKTDGHVWLDPVNAKAMVTEIARVLSERAPDNAARYKDNAAKATAAIDTLTSEITSDLAAVKGKPFVVFHDAYQYFEKRFGVEAVGSVTVSPEVQPSAKRLTAIRDKIKSLSATCVFAEPQFKSKLVGTVLEGTGAKSGTLDPEGANLTPGPDAYATLMRNLARDLKGCLGATS